ncbi:MAG: GNAT family N-acetyltransferase [Chloroflexota bacterium]
MAALRRITPDDLPRLRAFWQEHWSGEEMLVHGEVFRPEQLEGFVNDDWTGLVTYSIIGDGCEIISLDALKEGSGTGTALTQAVVDEAGKRGCRRVFLSATNDNLHALGFYQRRGFELVRVRRGAVTESRKHKPGIPLMGDNDIPMRDEIELELRLPAQLNAGRGP